MPSLAALQMLGMDEITWPVSYRFVTVGPQGWTQQELSFDIPALNGMHDATVACGQRLWAASVAPATTRNVQLVYYDCLIHHETPLPVIGGASFTFGLQLGVAAPRDHSGVVVMHTGHLDDRAARRLFVFGMPRTWQDGELLTGEGWDNLLAYAHALVMGLSSHFIGGSMQLLTMYPHVVESTPENLNGVGFRRVSDLRVCQYVDKAPDLSLGLWP